MPSLKGSGAVLALASSRGGQWFLGGSVLPECPPWAWAPCGWQTPYCGDRTPRSWAQRPPDEGRGSAGSAPGRARAAEDLGSPASPLATGFVTSPEGAYNNADGNFASKSLIYFLFLPLRGQSHFKGSGGGGSRALPYLPVGLHPGGLRLSPHDACHFAVAFLPRGALSSPAGVPFHLSERDRGARGEGPEPGAWTPSPTAQRLEPGARGQQVAGKGAAPSLSLIPGDRTPASLLACVCVLIAHYICHSFMLISARPSRVLGYTRGSAASGSERSPAPVEPPCPGLCAQGLRSAPGAVGAGGCEVGGGAHRGSQGSWCRAGS